MSVLEPTIADGYPTWLHGLDTCPSTNTWALCHHHQLEHGDVVYTPQQTAGRGQRGRHWQSPPGGLTFSIGLEVFSAQLPGLSLGMGLAVIQALEGLLPGLTNRLKLKWPNDVVVGQRKLAGILCETRMLSPNQPLWVVVGIGLNQAVEFTEPTLARKAISLSQLVSPMPTVFELLTQIRQQVISLVTSIDQAGIAAMLPQLTTHDALCGATLTFAPAGNGSWLVGQGAGLGPQGELLIQVPTGQVQAFASGRVMAWQAE